MTIRINPPLSDDDLIADQILHQTGGDGWFDDHLLELLDRLNDCSDPGGHVYLSKDDKVTCIHCRKEFEP